MTRQQVDSQAEQVRQKMKEYGGTITSSSIGVSRRCWIVAEFEDYADEDNFRKFLIENPFLFADPDGYFVIIWQLD